MTKVLVASKETIELTAECIKSGGIAVVPTDTNYNIVCDPFNEDAVQRIFDTKKRTKFGPLTLILPSIPAISRYTLPTSGFSMKIAYAFWPGEITFILNKQSNIPDIVTCGAKTIGVTYHANSVLQGVLEAFGNAVSASSANLSGQGDIFVTVEKAIDDLGECVDVILNAGLTSAAFHDSNHKSNSIVDFSFQPPCLVREGIVATEAIQKIIPELITDTDLYKVKLKERISKITYWQQRSQERLDLNSQLTTSVLSHR